MITRVSTLGVCLLALAAFVHGASSAQAQTSALALKSHHLFNLPAGVTEAELAAAIQGMNRAVAESGHPEAGYRVWKVTGEQSGDYSYLWEGSWPDQATYDAIHENEAWNEAIERFEPTLGRIGEVQVYNRFIEISTTAP